MKSDAEGNYLGKKKSIGLIAYAAFMTVLFITAAVLLGVVYFDDDSDSTHTHKDDDDNDKPFTNTSLTQYVMKNREYSADWDFEPIRKEGYTIYNINLTSGTWLTPSDSSTYVYWHWLQLCVPDVIDDPSMAFLWLNGGFNDGGIPTHAEYETVAVCLGTKSLSFGLHQAPNQPVTFNGDPSEQARIEDAIVAYTWSHFFNNSFATDWLARFPMTRAGVRAMDAGQAFWNTIRGNKPKIDRFVVAGASKRGWTSWLIGGMGDRRVVGVMPVVSPVANLAPQIDEQYKSLGFWSWVLYDFYSLNLMNFLWTPKFEELQALIDPRTYSIELKKVKKFQIGATNDEFFQPDALKWYWDDIPGQKNYRAVAGANHLLSSAEDPNAGFKVFAAAFPWIMSFKKGYDITLPKYDWKISEDGRTITVRCSTDDLVEDEITVWVSQNKKERDWRHYVCPPTPMEPCLNSNATWEKRTATKEEDGVYSYTIEEPGEGLYSAFLIELSYDLVDGFSNYLVSSDVSIVPKDKFAYDACSTCDCGWDCPTEDLEREEKKKIKTIYSNPFVSKN